MLRMSLPAVTDSRRHCATRLRRRRAGDWTGPRNETRSYNSADLARTEWHYNPISGSDYRRGWNKVIPIREVDGKRKPPG